MNHNTTTTTTKSKSSKGIELSVTYTEFSGLKPHQKPKFHEQVPWIQFVEKMTNPKEYPEKKKCPLLSMCEYGDILSERRVFRHGANILHVWGCEIDYDGKDVARMTIAEARDRLQAAGIQALLHTSASHTSENPRWRALFPFSQSLAAGERAQQVAKANEVLGGLITKESFTLSQAYYFGRVTGAEYEVHSTIGIGLDQVTGLSGIGKKNSNGNGSGYNEATDEELREAFRIGVGRYEAMQSLSARWAIQGFSVGDIVSSFEGLFNNSELDSSNADGIDLRTRIRPLAESAVSKYGDSRKIVIPQITIRRKAEASSTEFPSLPDGLVADIAEWSRKRSFSVNPKLDLAVALSATAFFTLNRYLIDGWKTPLQPYVLALAKTGSGKSEAQKSLTRLARSVSQGGFNFLDRMFSGFQSHHSFSDKLAEEPHAVLWNWDEAARSIKSAGKSGPEYDVLTHVIKMYGYANDTMLGMTGRNNPIPTIDNPFLVVLAMAQPNQLVAAVTKTDFETGLLARFLLLDAGEDIPPRNEEPSDLLKSSIGRHCRGFLDRSNTTFDKVMMAPGMHARWLEFDDHRRRMMAKSELFENFWSRATQQALMIAGILAVGRSIKAPMITSDLFDYAVGLTSHSVNGWVKRFLTEAAGANPYEKLVLRIESLLEEPKRFSKRASVKEKGLLKDGWVSRSLLVRSVRSNRRKDIDDVLDILMEAGSIQRKLLSSITCYRSNS